jgi:hypothetical protein
MASGRLAGSRDDSLRDGYHWHRFVTDSYSAQDRVIRGERRAFNARCDAILIDLRGKHRHERGLVDRRDYGFTQPFGRCVKTRDRMDCS